MLRIFNFFKLCSVPSTDWSEFFKIANRCDFLQTCCPYSIIIIEGFAVSPYIISYDHFGCVRLKRSLKSILVILVIFFLEWLAQWKSWTWPQTRSSLKWPCQLLFVVFLLNLLRWCVDIVCFSDGSGSIMVVVNQQHQAYVLKVQTNFISRNIV